MLIMDTQIHRNTIIIIIIIIIIINHTLTATDTSIIRNTHSSM